MGCCSLAAVMMQAPAASEVGMPMLHLVKSEDLAQHVAPAPAA